MVRMTTRFRKKRSTKKTSFGRRRRTYIRRNAKVNHLSCKRAVFGKFGVNGSDTVNNGSNSVTFALGDVPSAAEFTSLFDQYMIVGIQYRWRVQRDPSVNSSTAIANQGIFPRIYWVHDHDDAGASSTVSSLSQYPRMRELAFTANKDCTRWQYLKPAVANSIYGSVYNGYTAKWRTWLDCGYPNTPHYALKFYYENLNAGMQLYLDCKYVLKFKSCI